MTKTIHEFPNGFRLIHELSDQKINVSSAYFFCHVGSIDETERTRGGAHFIEHMCFKGTRKIPIAKEITKIYDDIGAYFNAYTVKEYTCYTLKCQDEYLDNCIDILSDMMFHSIFDKTEYKKELEVVIQENVNSSETYDSIIDDAMDIMTYNGSSYENPIDSIKYHRGNEKMFRYSDIINMYKTYYQPQNFTLSIVSNRPPNEIINILKKTYFVSLKSKYDKEWLERKANINMNINTQTEPQYTIIPKKGNQTTQVSIAFRTCDMYNFDGYALDLLQVIIGELFNSRLYTTLREKNGLTYKSFVSSEYYQHSGRFSLNAITEHDKLIHNKKRKTTGKGVIPLMIDIINDIIKNGITEAELDVAKQFKKSKLIMGLMRIDNITQYNGEYMLFYLPKNIEYVSYKNLFEKRYNNITVEDMNRIIQMYFYKVNMSVCVVGEKVPSVEIVREECERVVR